MRALAALLFVIGCKSEADRFHDDVVLFCTAYDTYHPRSMVELGPKIADRLRSDRFIALFDLRTFSIEALEQGVREAGVERCGTLAWLRSNSPR